MSQKCPILFCIRDFYIFCLQNEGKFLDLIQRRFLKELNIAIVHSDSGATVVTSSNLPTINTE